MLNERGERERRKFPHAKGVTGACPVLGDETNGLMEMEDDGIEFSSLCELLRAFAA
jgi:hypothetical protein